MRRLPMHLSLGVKLFLAFMVVNALVIGFLAWTVRHQTTREFNTYVIDRRRSLLAAAVGEAYAELGTWHAVALNDPLTWPVSAGFQGPEALWSAATPGTRVEPPLKDDPRPVVWPQFRVAVVDEGGHVILAGWGFQEGQQVARAVLRTREAIVVGGKTVGWVVTAVQQDPVRTAMEQRFLQRVDRALLVLAGGTVVLTLALSLLLSTSLARPVRDLTFGTRAIAKGELGHQVPVRSQDELGELARSFNTMSAGLARAEELRKQMTADIAHELRTPLSLILGHAEALDDGILPATPETMHIIHDEAQRLSRLVEDLRTLSLSDAGEMDLTLRPSPVARLVERSLAAHRAQASSRNIDLRVEVAPDLPAVRADPDRIAQVLANLLGNALRHTPDGGMISVSASQEPTGNAVRLTVRDSGPGIPPNELENVFERFYRTDRSRARPEGGTGLGLAIARSLVEAHGGKMWAEHQAGQGAVLCFALPIASTEEEDPG